MQAGQERPLFTSPLSNTYLTAGTWSPTRPAVLIVSCADGTIQAWDFTDSCSRPSLELHATHARVTTIEFLNSAASTSRIQLLALGDETGTLHVFEVPRNLTRPIPKEEQTMMAFFEREQLRIEYVKQIPEIEGFTNSGNSTLALAEMKIDRVSSAPMTASKPPDTAGNTQPADGAIASDVDESAKALREAQKKEEDEFLKAEAAFIAQLGMQWDALPEAIKMSHPQPKEEVKK